MATFKEKVKARRKAAAQKASLKRKPWESVDAFHRRRAWTLKNPWTKETIKRERLKAKVRAARKRHKKPTPKPTPRPTPKPQNNKPYGPERPGPNDKPIIVVPDVKDKGIWDRIKWMFD